ncbi:MAG: hypothetical protein H2212_03375 [Ruminococcus sp.]|nr:hypothetical protein [Ruminococcus sp.]
MGKEFRKQYSEIRAEINDLKGRIAKEKKKIYDLQLYNKNTTTDMGILKKLECFIDSTDECQEFVIRCRVIKLKFLEEKLSGLLDKVENDIEKIPVSDLRLMFRLYYIDGLTWEIVALKMNFAYPKRRISYTGDSCRIRHNRYLKKINHFSVRQCSMNKC